MRRTLVAVFAFVVCNFFASRADAQVTTADLRGTVISNDDRQPIGEATITLINGPTGYVKTTTTNSDGEFAFSGLPIGGPYRVKAESGGFRPSEEKAIFLTAGKARDVLLRMKLQDEVIEVSGTTVPRNTSGRTVVTSAELDQLPSVTRDPRDFVRRTPEASVEGSDHTLSIGGANTRFNSITVDG
ncbi:MAG TPA: carboxypeptidase-like regulatory domain-containing protein, partial [Kofleriaceae bacterium]|nr:carboxypeptidase-like regulatory domain-containing protein [Kofleriaceae bacterium]